MDKRIEFYWVEKYPNMFQGYHLTKFKSTMARGFTCGNGWFYILDGLLKWLSEFENIIVGQVKEKFGGLRVYTNLPYAGEKRNQLVNAAITLSFETCEMCGAAGERRSGDWLFTLCDSCHGSKDLWAISEETGIKIVKELGLRTTCKSDKDHILDRFRKSCLCCGAKRVEGKWEV